MSAAQKQEKKQHVPVGIDLGSLYARIAIATGDSSSSPPSIDVVSNTQGSRSTLAFCTVEEPALLEEDVSKGKMNTDLAHVLIGEAAQRALYNRKEKHLHHSSVRHLVRMSSSVSQSDPFAEPSSDEKKSDDDVKQTTHQEHMEKLASAFFTQISNLICDASSSHPSQLKCVVSVPISSEHSYSKEEVDQLISCIQRGIDQFIAEDGKGKKKKGKKKNKEMAIVGVITEPMAVCIAHGLTRLPSVAQPQDHRLSLSSTAKAQEEPSVPNGASDDSNSAPSTWKTCLILDWGASGITLVKVSNNSPSSVVSITQVQHDSTLSGNEITSMVMTHVATQFERKNRLPAGSVTENYKARVKLHKACSNAIKTLSRTSTTTISIDGLYEGMDCMVALSRPRLEMLLSNMVRKVEALILGFSSDGIDVMLPCGSVCDMPMVKDMMERLCPTAWKGKASVPVDEVVAIGCAMHAHEIVRYDCLMTENDQDGFEDEDLQQIVLKSLEQTVMLSPLGIGVALVPSTLEELDTLSAATVPLIAIGTPLPAVAYKIIDFELSGSEVNNVVAIVELSKEDANSETDFIPRIIAKIPVSPDRTEVGLFMELTEQGKLSISVDGSEPVTL